MTDLYLHQSGDTAHPGILFLHGSPLTGRMWQPQLESLAQCFHCLAPDLPEHGRSAEVKPFLMEDTVQRLADLIHHQTSKGKAHVVGLSFGGVVAQALIVRYPELVDHMILSGTSGQTPGC